MPNDRFGQKTISSIGRVLDQIGQCQYRRATRIVHPLDNVNDVIKYGNKRRASKDDVNEAEDYQLDKWQRVKTTINFHSSQRVWTKVDDCIEEYRLMVLVTNDRRTRARGTAQVPLRFLSRCTNSTNGRSDGKRGIRRSRQTI